MSSREVALSVTPSYQPGMSGQEHHTQSLVPSPSHSCPVKGQICWEQGFFHPSHCPLLSGESRHGLGAGGSVPGRRSR